MDDESVWETWARGLASQVPRLELKKMDGLVKELLKAMTERKKMTQTLESYLMANCANSDVSGFEQRAGELAGETLAYFLASADE